MPPAIMPRAQACATKNANLTLRSYTASKSASVTSHIGFGRLVPALLTSTWNAGRAAKKAATASRSLTSSTADTALPPVATMASAAASISLAVRATSVTSAPASASAAAAASPIARPAPVTSARRPSSRKLGVRGKSVMLPSRKRVRDKRGGATIMRRPCSRAGSWRSCGPAPARTRYPCVPARSGSRPPRRSRPG